MRHLIAICSLAVLVGLSQAVVGAPMPTVDTPTPGGDIIVHKAPFFDVTSTVAGPNSLTVDLSGMTDLSGAVMTGTIKIAKVTDPTGGTGFDFMDNIPGSGSFTLDDAGMMTFADVPVGSYFVTEDDPAPGFDLTDLTCVDIGEGGTASTGDPDTRTATINLDTDETVTCTFTNTERATIIIEKQTLPDADPTMFTFTGDVAGTLVDGGTAMAMVEPGTYTSTETVPMDWELTDITCDTGGSGDEGTATFVVGPGETVKCTFTNTKRGKIIIEKVTDPTGGTSFGFTDNIPGSGSFTLDDAGMMTFTDVPVGSYFVTEDDPTPGFDLTGLTCVDTDTGGTDSTTDLGGREATIELDPGETVTCTFTNTKRGRIIIDKVTDPLGDDTSFLFTLTGGPSELDQSFSLDDAATPHDSGLIMPGSGYALAETVPDNWNLKTAECSNESPVDDITVSPGETVTCTFTNLLGVTVSKSFTDDPVPPGGIGTLEFTITNLNTAATATDIEFNDDLEATLTGLESTSFIEFPGIGLLPIFNVCGSGSKLEYDLDLDPLAPPDTSVLILTSGTLDPGASCTFSVQVKVPDAAALGAHENVTTAPTAEVGGTSFTGLPASDDLNIAEVLTVTKVFLDDQVIPGSTVVLKFTINNFHQSLFAEDIDFTDDLTMVLDDLTAITLPPDGFCGPASKITGSLVLSIEDASVGPSDSCNFNVTLQVPADASNGSFFNTTSPPMFFLGEPPDDETPPLVASPATDFLDVGGLRLEKSFTDDPVFPGEMVTLEFTITNLSGENLEDISFMDNVEAVLSGLAPSSGQLPLDDVCGDGSVFDTGGLDAQGKNLSEPPLELSGGNLLAGASCTFSLTLDVPPGAAPGPYLNSTTEITGMIVGDGTIAKSQETITGEPATDFLDVFGIPLLTKTFIDDPVVPGGSVTLTFNITNPDPQHVVREIAFTDDLDAALEGLVATSFETTEGGDPLPIADVCGPGSELDYDLDPGTDTSVLILTGGSLDPDDSCMFSVTLEVPAGATPMDYPNTTSALTAEVGGTSETSGEPITTDSASDPLIVAAVPVFTKAFSPDVVSPGDEITLTFTITNTNPSEAATDIEFTDDLDILDIDGDPNTDVTTTLGVVTLPDDDFCGDGSMLTETDGVLTMTGGSIPADDFCTFDVILTVPEEITVFSLGEFTVQDLGPGTYLNTTSILSSMVGEDSFVFESQPTSDDFIVAGLPTFIKSFADDTAEPGGTVVLSFTIVNPDPNSSLTGIAFTDDLDAVLTDLAPTDLPKTDICGTGSGINVTVENILEFAGGSVDPQSDCTFNVTLQIPAGAAPGSNSNTTSDLTATFQGVPLIVDPATDDLDLSVPLLLFTKAFSEETVTPGQEVTLEFTITNLDPDHEATGMLFTDDLGDMFPSIAATGLSETDVCGVGSFWFESSPGNLSFLLGKLAKAGDPDDSCTFSVTFTVPISTDPSPYSNVTSVLTATIDTESVTTPPATDDLLVVAPLTFLKAFTDDPVIPGETVTLEFSIAYEAEDGAPDLTGITFTDDLDAVLEGLVASVLPDNGFCGTGSTLTGTDELTMTGGVLEPGTSCTFSVTLDVPADALAGSYSNITSAIEGEQEDEGRTTAKNQSTITGDPATDDLLIAAIPVIRKAFTDDPVAPGGTVTLEFTITNPSTTDEATEISFMDDLDAVLTGLEVTSFEVDEGGGFVPIADVCGTGSELTLTDPAKLTLSEGSLAQDSDCTFSVTIAVPESATPGSYSNVTDSLTAVVDDEAVTGNTAMDNLDVMALPLLVKRFTDDPVAPGGTVTLEFTLTNTNTTASAADLAFTDDLDAVITGLVATGLPASDICGDGSEISGTDVLTFTGGSLDPDASCTFSVTLDVPLGTSAGTYPNVTSVVSADVGGSPLEGSAATDDLVVSSAPELSKSFTDDPSIPGGTVTLEFTLTYGDATATATAITFTDDLDAVLTGLEAVGLPLDDVCGPGSRIDGTSELTLTGGSLNPETSCTFSVTLDVPADAEAGLYPNTTSEVTAAVDGLPVTTEAATDDLEILAIALSKAFTDDPVTPGATVTLEFTITNLDPDHGASAIAFSDTLDAVIPGLVATSLPSSECGGMVSTPDGGSTIDFTGGTLDPGASCTFSVSLTVPGSTDPTEYPNTTSEGTATIDSEEVTVPTATDVLIVAAPLTILKTFTDDPVAPGATVTLEFSITYVAEDGDPDATDISFSDNLDDVLDGLVASVLPDDGFCGPSSMMTDPNELIMSGGSLEPGTSCTFSVTLNVPEDALEGSYTNTTSEVTAEVGGGTTLAKNQSTLTGDPATDDLLIAAIPVIRKEFTDDPVAPGGTVTLEFTITNSNTTEEATDIAFTDDLEVVLSGLVAVGLPADDVCGTGSELTGPSLLELTGGTLPPGDSCTFTVTLLVPTDADLGTYTNETDTLTAVVDDVSVKSNSATDDLDVEGLPQLVKSFIDDPAAPGGSVTLEFTITNTDPGMAASDIEFTDDLDAVIMGLVATGLPSSECGGTVSTPDSGSTIEFTGGSLAVGASCTFTVTLTIPAGVSEGNYPNTTSSVTAQIGGQSVEGKPASDDLQIVSIPVLSKSFIDDPGMPGDTLNLVFTITHLGGILDATAIAFTDDLGAVLAGLVAVDLPASECGGTISTPDGGSTIVFTGGSLTAGTSCTFSVRIVVPSTATPGSTLTNTTSALTADVGGVSVTGDPASDDLQIAGLLSLTKEFTDGPVASDGTVTLEFTLTNNDPDHAASDIEFTDDLDAVIMGLVATGLPSSECGGTVSTPDDGSTIEFAGGSLDAGESCTFSVSLTVPGGVDPAQYTNTTSAATATIDGESVTALPATDVLDVVEALVIEKSFTDDPVMPAAAVTLKFTITFEGETEATDITFTDMLDVVIPGLVADGLPADDVCGMGSTLTGTDILTLTGGRLDPGTMCMFTVTLQVPANAPDGSFLNTTSTVEAQVDGEDIEGSPATDELDIVTPPMLDVTKVDELLDTDGLVQPGDTLKYTVKITNISDRDATGVVFTDSLDVNTLLDCDSVMPAPTDCTPGPSGMLRVDVGTIEDGEMATIMYTVTIVSPYPAEAEAATVKNQGLVEGDNFADVLTDDPATEDDDDPTVTEITRESDFSLTKTADPTMPDYHDTVVFTLTVTNNGPVPSPAKVTDILPDGLIFVEADPEDDYDENTGVWRTDEIAVGEFRVLTITALVDALEPVTNEATVSSEGFPDPVEGNNTDDAEITPVAADLAITKSLVDFVGDPDDAFTFTATFKLTVTNNGPSDATGVEVSDPLPDGTMLVSHTLTQGTFVDSLGVWTIGELAKGASAMLTIVLKATGDNNVVNIATVSGEQPDQNEKNNLAATQAQHDPPDPFIADLSLTKTVDNETPSVGDLITYLINVTNGGPSTTVGVVVRDALPDGVEFVSAEATSEGTYTDSLGVWSVGPLTRDSSATLAITVRVTGTGEITNTAEVIESHLPDRNGNNDIASATITVSSTVTAAPDLTLTKDDGGATAQPGGVVVYKLTYTNNGDEGATGVALTETVPDNATFNASASTDGWSCSDGDPPGTMCTFSVASEVAGGGGMGMVNFAVTVDDSVPVGVDEIDNTASVEDDSGDDPNLADNTATATTPLQTATSIVRDGGEGIPTEFELQGNYPNPFNPETVIPFGVPEQVHVRMAVYDLLGREVALLLDEVKSVGRYELRWQAGRFPTGVYIVRMQAGSTVKTRRVTLLK